MSRDARKSPFDITHLLNLPELPREPGTKWQGFVFEDEIHDAIFSLPELPAETLPRLELGSFKTPFGDVPFPSVEPLAATPVRTDDEKPIRVAESPQTEPTNVEDNVWLLPDIIVRKTKSELCSWDHFYNIDNPEPSSAYLTEHNAKTFDAVLQATSDQDLSPAFVKQSPFIDACFNLGLGRSSKYFEWDHIRFCFTPTCEKLTVSGFSIDTVRHMVESFGRTGTQILILAQKYKQCLHRLCSFSAAQIAFYTAAKSCIGAIHAFLETARPKIVTLLRLQNTFEGPALMISLLSTLGAVVNNAKDNFELLDRIIKHAQDLALSFPKFDSVLRQIVSAIAKPALGIIREKIGLSPNSSVSEFSANGGENSRDIIGQSLFDADITNKIREVQDTLKLLRDHAPERLQDFTSSKSNVVLQIHYTWEDIGKLQISVGGFEKYMKSAILDQQRTDYELSGSVQPDQQGYSSCEETLTENFACNDPFELIHIGDNMTGLIVTDVLKHTVLHCLDDIQSYNISYQADYQQAFNMSLAPYVDVQHRLLSFSILDSLYQKHHFVRNSRLLRQFHLLGSGAFASRLSTSLFEPREPGSESQRHVPGMTGLSMQSRNGWPPSSSELRLVLVGILSESLHHEGLENLEPSISFAIRDLSDDELEKCRDVASIHALDFIRLQYKPSSPILEAVVSSECLEKYDRIFQHLLRLLRVQSVSRALLRETCTRGRHALHGQDQRFKVEMQQFVSAFAAYTQDIALGLPWSRFEEKLCMIEEQVKARDYNSTLSTAKSLKNLHDMHNNTVDEMLRAVLLKKRYKALRMVLEEIFGIILRYAACHQNGKANTDDGNDVTTKRLYEEFQTHVRRFLVLARQAAQEVEERKIHSENDINVFEDLLARLDMFDYWRISGK